MVKIVGFSTLFAVVAMLLESALQIYIPIIRITPELAMCIIIFSAAGYGVMAGQLTGFLSGLCLDFLSASPLGVHMFVFTIIGAAAGLLRGNFVLDAFFFPMLLGGGATLLKALLLSFLNVLFMGNIVVYSYITPPLWIELLLNMVCAPFVFALLKITGKFLRKQVKGFTRV
jgi:rod shape-determining protein MreD